MANKNRALLLSNIKNARTFAPSQRGAEPDFVGLS